MKMVLFLIVTLLFIHCRQSSLQCLLQQPVTDQCLQSLQISSVNPQMYSYLCIITSQRQLNDKSQQFCRLDTANNQESGYRYLQALLLNHKFKAALQTQYELFFSNPFDHNGQLLQILQETSSKLSQLQARQDFNGLNNFQKAIFYFYQNKTDKSESFLKQHIKQQDSSQLIYQHLLMSRLLEKDYRYYDGLNYISDVINKNAKRHAYFYHLKGNFLMHHVQFQKAIKQYEISNQQFDKIYNSKGFSFSNYNIGLCYQKLGKIQEAMKYYQKSIINLNSAEALNALGHAYFSLYQANSNKNNNKNYLIQAQNYYLKSLQIKNEYNLPIFNLGILYLTKKQSPKALQYFERCIKMQNTFRSCKYGLIKGYYQNNSTQKVNEVILSIQKNEQTLAQLAAILYEANDSKRALELIGQKDDYKSLQLMEWKGFNEYAVGDYESASKSFARAIFLGSKKGYIYFSLGLSQFEQKLYEQCYNSFDTAYKLDPRKETKEKRQQCKKKMETQL